MANEFNTFYIDKVNKIRKSIPKAQKNLSNYTRPFKGKVMTEFRPVTVDEVKKIIIEKGIKTSVGDPIPSKLLQPSQDVVLPVSTSH